jgi:hypothetical protein
MRGSLWKGRKNGVGREVGYGVVAGGNGCSRRANSAIDGLRLLGEGGRPGVASVERD